MITVTADHLAFARDAHVKMVDTFGDWSEQAMHAEGICDALAWVLGEGAPYGILSDIAFPTTSDEATKRLREKLTCSSL